MQKFIEQKNGEDSIKEQVLKIKQALTFDDVLIVPKFSDIEHRAEASCSTEVLPGLKLEKPFISANMDSVTEHGMAFAMAQLGCLGILHRYLSIEESLKQYEQYKELVKEDGDKVKTPFIVSIGVHDRERITKSYEAGIRNFCIDVAHGHHILVKKTIEFIRKEYGEEVGIIAGNVCTYQGAYDLYDWGADTVKVGIGPGSVCSTRIKTGVGYPQFTAIFNCNQAKEEFTKKSGKRKYLIGDGGIKNYGDVTKALAAGADTVMMGSIFAGCKQTPGRVWRNEKEEMIKTYRGMASSSAQSDFGIEDINEEGISLTVKYKGNIEHIIDRLTKGLKSGMSYSGARSIAELQDHPEFIRMTQSGYYESRPHKAG